MKTKTLRIAVWGEEICLHRRLLNIEVPHDATNEEIEDLSQSVFDDVAEPPEWELEDSHEIWGSDSMGSQVEVQSTAPDNEPIHARLEWNKEGEVVLVTGTPMEATVAGVEV